MQPELIEKGSRITRDKFQGASEHDPFLKGPPHVHVHSEQPRDPCHPGIISNSAIFHSQKCSGLEMKCNGPPIVKEHAFSLRKDKVNEGW